MPYHCDNNHKKSSAFIPNVVKSCTQTHFSSHIRTQHQSRNLKISQSRFLNGICVDQRNGIYLVRKQWHGVDYPIHCQFMVTPPASIQCSSQVCRQYAETSIRSGQSGFLCDHLQSTHFLKPVSNSLLLTEKLDFITNRLYV